MKHTLNYLNTLKKQGAKRVKIENVLILLNSDKKRSEQLPTKEEMEIALETLLEYKLKDKSEYDKITFKFGFRTCYLWLANRSKK